MSADALDDEWWLAPEERETRVDRKRNKDGENLKKRKRRKITDILSEAKNETQDVLHSTSRQYNELCTALKPLIDKLPVVESSQVEINESSFICYNNTEGEELLVATYISEVCPRWYKWVRKYTGVNGAPIIIVITSSAERASELKRQLLKNYEDNIILKLCAKHSKIDDQVTYLTSHVTHIIVGTPNRIGKLANDKYLKLCHLKLVIIDWYWRDKKLKCTKDIPEIWRDFVSLYVTHFNDLVMTKQCKIGLL